ncbi:hypothetical protein BDR04DRAFT_249 [Suillus decipiens]|nr:hypothetical protein BDR04DRAFT_249 [Suillus decipiens]
MYLEGNNDMPMITRDRSQSQLRRFYGLYDSDTLRLISPNPTSSIRKCTFRADCELANVKMAFVSAHVEILILVLLDENGEGPCPCTQIALSLRRFALRFYSLPLRSPLLCEALRFRPPSHLPNISYSSAFGLVLLLLQTQRLLSILNQLALRRAVFSPSYRFRFLSLSTRLRALRTSQTQLSFSQTPSTKPALSHSTPALWNLVRENDKEHLN